MTQQKSRNQPYALNAGEGWVYRAGIDFTVKASEIREGSSATFLEFITRQGEEPESHSHNTEDEMFYVLEGAITFHCGEEIFNLERGGFIFLPRGIVHSYVINNPDPVRMIVVTSPVREGLTNGWGGFVSEMESGQGELIIKPG
jgi:quercetin dioxygenase-like cupin family protein